VSENTFWLSFAGLCAALLVAMGVGIHSCEMQGQKMSVECVKMGGEWRAGSGSDRCERRKR
jgi:hypothetical protein